MEASISGRFFEKKWDAHPGSAKNFATHPRCGYYQLLQDPRSKSFWGAFFQKGAIFLLAYPLSLPSPSTNAPSLIGTREAKSRLYRGPLAFVP